MAFGYNDDHVRHLIEDGKVEISSAVARLVDDLIDNSAIRIPSQVCSTYEERKAIIANAVNVALVSVLNTDCSMLDDETRWLYVARVESPLAVAAE
jgi:hypothetical protein